MIEKRIMSGMRPTGKLHLGHLVGVTDNWLKFQEENECFFEIADWHAMTDRSDYSAIKRNIFELTKDWLALGIDPNKSTIFIQSFVPEHAVLYTIFSMMTSVSRLQRSPVYKDRIAGESTIKNPMMGLLGYPILQAADIALYKGTHVPVGKDQAPHIELTREIIRRFNGLYKEIFPEPQTILTENPRLIGIDGRKMSKSYGNFISPGDSIETLEGKTREMITDPNKVRKNDPGNPEICNVYSIHAIYNPNRSIVYNECVSGERGCVDCKAHLAKVLGDYFKSFREKREFYDNHHETVREVLFDGSNKARRIAISTLDEVRDAIGIGTL